MIKNLEETKKEFVEIVEKFLENTKNEDVKEDMLFLANMIAQKEKKYIGKSIKELYLSLKKEL